MLLSVLLYAIISSSFFFFLNDPAPPEISTLPHHAPFPISSIAFSTGIPHPSTQAVVPAVLVNPCRAGSRVDSSLACSARVSGAPMLWRSAAAAPASRSERSASRSEEHTSELQSRLHLVCRLLLEKKKAQQQQCYTLTQIT